MVSVVMSKYSWLGLPKFVRSGGLMLLIVAITGCNALKWPVEPEQCKVRTYINYPLRTYISARYGDKNPVRTMILPFVVPESFTGANQDIPNFGKEIAAEFAAQLREAGVLPIVELYNVDRWPGRREDFSTGNFQAINLARNAGFDFLLVGYLEDLKADDTFNVQIKLIDISNNITLNHSLLKATSKDRLWRREIGRSILVQDVPAIYSFPEITDEAARCGVEALLNEESIPQ